MPLAEQGLPRSPCTRCRRLSLQPVQKVLLFHGIGVIDSVPQPNRMWSGWLPAPSHQLVFSDALRGSNASPPGTARPRAALDGEERPGRQSAGPHLRYREGSREGWGGAWASQPSGTGRRPGKARESQVEPVCVFAGQGGRAGGGAFPRSHGAQDTCPGYSQGTKGPSLVVPKSRGYLGGIENHKNWTLL